MPANVNGLNDVEWTESHRRNGGRACSPLNWESVPNFSSPFWHSVPGKPALIIATHFWADFEPPFTSKFNNYWLSADRSMQWRAFDGIMWTITRSLFYAVFISYLKRANFEKTTFYRKKIKRDYTFTTYRIIYNGEEIRAEICSNIEKSKSSNKRPKFTTFTSPFKKN